MLLEGFLWSLLWRYFVFECIYYKSFVLNSNDAQFAGVPSRLKNVLNVQTDAALLGAAESIICLTVTWINVKHF